VSVRGTVVRVSSIKPLCLQMAYECNNCGTVQVSVRGVGMGWGGCKAYTKSRVTFHCNIDWLLMVWVCALAVKKCNRLS